MNQNCVIHSELAFVAEIVLEMNYTTEQICSLLKCVVGSKSVFAI
jgi:hypothetical protein